MKENKTIYNTEWFIERAKKIHGDKYDYSKVDYVNNHTKVCIICPIHGEFWQNPANHLRGQGCRKCAVDSAKIRYAKPKSAFIEKAKKVHESKYDYSKVEYINNHTKVCIICPKHGEFWQTPRAHLGGNGCSKCKGEKTKERQTLTTNEFIEKAKKVHRSKYDYSKVKYINTKTKVCIICPKHGEFWQRPNDHLKGKGCYECNANKVSNEIVFTLQAKQVHGDKYDYSKVNYVNNKKKVCIICPKHGEFWQTPHAHLGGNGCPKCRTSKLENDLKKELENNNIHFEQQKSFDWLFSNKKLHLDFYLPDYNVAIECQGIQHFKSVKQFGGDKNLELQINRDKIKQNLCQENDIKVLYWSNIGIEYPYKVFEDINELIKAIKNE